jgi:hypothetical protein
LRQSQRRHSEHGKQMPAERANASGYLDGAV